MEASSVRRLLRIRSSRIRPAESSTRRIQKGSCRMPPVASVAKAEAISSGLTPEVPRATDGTEASGLLIPQRRAASITAPVPDALHQLGGDRVHAAGQRALQDHRPLVLAAEVPRRPGRLARNRDRHLAVHEHRRRAQPRLLKGGVIEEGLEPGPGQPVVLNGAVVFGFAVIPAAHQRPHRSGVSLDRHQRRLRVGAGIAADRRRDFEDLIQLLQTALDGFDGPAPAAGGPRW